jgi:predicted 3-demethylubiquinone-9 3-methyltransferase (glyoxalase superfamily)
MGDRAEEAARFYVGVFPSSKIKAISHYSEAGKEIHQRPPGSVLVVEFELDGQPFLTLNGGPESSFTDAISFQILCKSQAEIDRYWERLTADGGKPIACGWLVDKFGVSWQVTPENMDRMLTDEKSPAYERVFSAMMTMVKLDMAALERAYAGK